MQWHGLALIQCLLLVANWRQAGPFFCVKRWMTRINRIVFFVLAFDVRVFSLLNIPLERSLHLMNCPLALDGSSSQYCGPYCLFWRRRRRLFTPSWWKVIKVKTPWGTSAINFDLPKHGFNFYWPFQGSFFFIFVFSVQLTVNIKLADDWIRTADLYCPKRPLYLLSHITLPP